MVKSVLYFVFTLAFVSCSSISKRDYYLPEGFNGEVAIIYNKGKGTEPSFKEGRLQIMVPDSGIVFLKSEYSPGSIDYQYFIKTLDGYTRLNRDDFRDFAKDEKRIFMERVMTFSFPKEKNVQDSVTVIAELFYVGRKLDTAVGRKRFLFENYISELTKSLTE